MDIGVIPPKQRMRKMREEKKANKKKLFKVVGVALAISAVVAFSAVACGGHDKMSDKMMKRMLVGYVEDLMDEIDADDAERTRFAALAKGIADEALTLKKAHKAQGEAVIRELQKPSPDREKLHARVDEKFDLVEDFAHRTLDKVLDAYETLDPDQKQIVIDKLANHMEKH